MDNSAYSAMHHHMMNSGPMQHHDPSCYPPSPYSDPAAISREALFFQSIHPAFAGGIENYLDPKYASDPAAFASRLPYLPFHAAYGVYDYGFEPAFIRKRNERERQRVKCVNEGYARLREHLPDEYAEKRLSKVETLRGAIQYIKQLQDMLGLDKEAKRKKRKRKAAEGEEGDKLEKIEDKQNQLTEKATSGNNVLRAAQDLLVDSQCSFAESKQPSSTQTHLQKQNLRFKDVQCSYAGHDNIYQSHHTRSNTHPQVQHSSINNEVLPSPVECDRNYYGWQNCDLNRFYQYENQRYTEASDCSRHYDSSDVIARQRCENRDVTDSFQTNFMTAHSHIKDAYATARYPRPQTSRNGFETRGGDSDGFKSDNSPISLGASP
uniref:BHLH domain-containing protein n=1 Tax=Ciona intestinalis TaxID=7719 RepID=F6SUJ3_CIOIN